MLCCLTWLTIQLNTDSADMITVMINSSHTSEKFTISTTSPLLQWLCQCSLPTNSCYCIKDCVSNQPIHFLDCPVKLKTVLKYHSYLVQILYPPRLSGQVLTDRFIECAGVYIFIDVIQNSLGPTVRDVYITTLFLNDRSFCLFLSDLTLICFRVF